MSKKKEREVSPALGFEHTTLQVKVSLVFVALFAVIGDV